MSPPAETAWRIRISGTVQGVGFRPFVFRLANELGLRGRVWNTTDGVVVETACAERLRDTFCARLRAEAPPAAEVLPIECEPLTESVLPEQGFRIVESTAAATTSAVLPPDLATCPDCRRELLDPADPRHRYPFINCTNCGPRFSIVEKLPYDRANTTMRVFPLSERCAREYNDPGDRRFHAEPNADNESGPRLAWKESGQPVQCRDEAALQKAARRLRDGRIVAVKGLGGFHLMCRADLADAVRRLREKKGREVKPLAVMLAEEEEVRHYCLVSEEEAVQLRAAAAPIVLLRKRDPGLWPEVSELSTLGVLLPYTPLHLLLLEACPYPLVATSGNITDEPICINNAEAEERLSAVAEGFLLHDRPIARPVDDSVLRVVKKQRQLLRRSRGFAPAAFALPRTVPPCLCMGGDLKNTVAIARGREVVLSQHIGDLETEPAQDVFRRSLHLLRALFESGDTARFAVHDLHPGYHSTRAAAESGLPLLGVQHHEAHAWGCLAEHGLLEQEALCIIWDGTGYGHDGTVWGGEAFRYRGGSLRRCARLRPFDLLGGDAAAREPWRPAMAMLLEILGPEAVLASAWPGRWGLAPESAAAFARAHERRIQCVATSSMGRLFDAAAALAGLCLKNRYEGEAAMNLEEAGQSAHRTDAFPLPLRAAESGLREWDWEPLVRAMAGTTEAGAGAAIRSDRFHGALVNGIVDLAVEVNLPAICLSGGCFQNRRLLEGTEAALRAKGFSVHWPQRYPCNDGGLALGQAVAACCHPNLPI